MIRRFGKERALAMQAEAKAAREDLVQFIAQEKIDCDFKLTGRFTGASSPDRVRPAAARGRGARKTLGIEAFALDRARQRDALGTDYYWGGQVRMDIGGLHPAKLLAGMLRWPTRPVPSSTARPRSHASCRQTAASRSRRRGARSARAT